MSGNLNWTEPYASQRRWQARRQSVICCRPQMSILHRTHRRKVISIRSLLNKISFIATVRNERRNWYKTSALKRRRLNEYRRVPMHYRQVLLHYRRVPMRSGLWLWLEADTRQIQLQTRTLSDNSKQFLTCTRSLLNQPWYPTCLIFGQYWNIRHRLKGRFSEPNSNGQ